MSTFYKKIFAAVDIPDFVCYNIKRKIITGMMLSRCLFYGTNRLLR